jgi:enamine deaminase RidA (YjgF/YER057c/UK114 family)
MLDIIIKYAVSGFPIWMWPACAGGSAVVYFLFHVLSALPQIKPWAFLIKPVSAIVLMISIFMYGGAGVDAIYKAAFKEQQQQLALAQQAADSVTAQLQQALANNQHLVEGRAYGVKQIIIKDTAKINADCKRINNDAWEDYNRAVKNTGSKQLPPSSVTVTGAPAK